MARRFKQALRAVDRHTMRTMNPTPYEIESRPRRLV
jgi:hypothetical protein